MARSRLFRFLKRSLKKATHLTSESPLSRREFIAGFAAVTGATTAAIAAQEIQKKTHTASLLKTRNQNEKIVIVGAGLSGLTASYRLLQKGIRTEIYEGQPRLGGRIYTKYNFNEEGMFVDMGGELIDTGHEDLLALCKELNLEVQDFNDEDKNLGTLFYSQGKVRSEQEFISGLQPLLRSMKTDLKALMVGGKLVSPTYQQPLGAGAKKLDFLSLAEYLASKRSFVDRWVLDIVEVAFVSEYGLESHEMSSLDLLVLFGLEHSEKDPKIYGESDECKRVDGGNQRLIAALSDRIGGMNPIHLEHRLIKIQERSHGIELTFSNGGATQIVQADRVIMGLPFTTLREVEGIYELPLTRVKKKAIAEMGYGSNYKLNLGFKSRFWREKNEFAAPNKGSFFTDLDSQCFWEMSRMQKGKKGILTAYFGGDLARKLVPHWADRTLADLAKIYPKVHDEYDGKYLMMAWTQMAFIKGSYSAPLKGQYTTILGSAKESELGGRLIFTGEHCSLANQGFMNGAVETGNWAAQAIFKGRLSSHRGVAGGH